MIVDLFAGPGGWDEGLRMLGRDDVVGIEWDTDACATATAAGHARILADCWSFPPRPCEGLAASPPCTTFSMAGGGAGRAALATLRRSIEAELDGRLDRRAATAAVARIERARMASDPTWSRKPRSERSERARRDALVSMQVTVPAKWIRQADPQWVALEQVPPVLPLWECYARALRRRGWSAWAGVLSAECFGVPQTRKRAFLLASRVREVTAPEPTHAAYDPRNPQSGRGGELTLFGERAPWRSIADALACAQGVSPRPTPTVTSGGVDNGGVEVFASRGARAAAARAVAYRNDNQPNTAERRSDEPAPTVHFGHNLNEVRWVMAGAGRTAQQTAGQQPRDPSLPAHTLTGAGSAAWVHDHPATTVVGSFRPDVIAASGYRTEQSRQDAEGSVRVTVQEASVLQSFPHDYPWRGSKTSRYRQVGNAVPPLLSAAVLRTLI